MLALAPTRCLRVESTSTRPNLITTYFESIGWPQPLKHSSLQDPRVAHFTPFFPPSPPRPQAHHAADPLPAPQPPLDGLDLYLDDKGSVIPPSWAPEWTLGAAKIQRKKRDGRDFYVVVKNGKTLDDAPVKGQRLRVSMFSSVPEAARAVSTSLAACVRKFYDDTLHPLHCAPMNKSCVGSGHLSTPTVFLPCSNLPMSTARYVHAR